MKDKFVTAADLAARSGFTARHFQRLAASGRIKWAFQPGGEGNDWRFSLAGFEQWWEAGRSGTRCHGTYTSEGKSGTSKGFTGVGNTAGALKRRLYERRRLA